MILAANIRSIQLSRFSVFRGRRRFHTVGKMKWRRHASTLIVSLIGAELQKKDKKVFNHITESKAG